MYRRSLLACCLGRRFLSALWGQQIATRPVVSSFGFRRAGNPIGRPAIRTPLVQSSLGQSFVIDEPRRRQRQRRAGSHRQSRPTVDTLGHVDGSVIITDPLLYKNMTIDVERDLAPSAPWPTRGGRGSAGRSAGEDYLAIVAACPRASQAASSSDRRHGSVDHHQLEVIRRADRPAPTSCTSCPAARRRHRTTCFGRAELHASRPTTCTRARSMPGTSASSPSSVRATGAARRADGDERGLSKLVVVSWQAIVAPAHASDAIIDRLEGVRPQGPRRSEMRELYAEAGILPNVHRPGDRLPARVKRSARSAAIVKEQNIQVD